MIKDRFRYVSRALFLKDYVIHIGVHPKYLVHECSDAMDICVPDLDKDRPAFVKESARSNQAITQIAKVRMNFIFPCISKRPNDFRLPRNAGSAGLAYMNAFC